MSLDFLKQPDKRLRDFYFFPFSSIRRTASAIVNFSGSVPLGSEMFFVLYLREGPYRPSITLMGRSVSGCVPRYGSSELLLRLVLFSSSSSTAPYGSSSRPLSVCFNDLKDPS